MASKWGSHVSRMAAAAILLMMVSPAFAQWTGKGQLGVALSTGNGDSMNANMRINVSHTKGDWERNIGFTGVYESDDDETTSQLLEIEGDGRRTFNARDFWFSGVRYQDDRFSGFRYQGTLSSGFGRRFIDTDKTNLTGRLGVGFKFSETRDAIDPGTGLLVYGDTENSLAGVAGLDWKYQANGTTTVYNNFYIEAASQNTFVRNEVGVSVTMTSRLALALAYTVRHNTDPPVSYDSTETLLTANVVYEVK
jgi:putative salt-induced outer membrane protein